DDDPAVRLDGDGEGDVVTAREVRGDLAPGAERDVERAVDVVADDAEVDRAGDRVRPPHGDDLVVALDGDPLDRVLRGGDRGRDLASGPECGVEVTRRGVGTDREREREQRGDGYRQAGVVTSRKQRMDSRHHLLDPPMDGS